MVDTEETEDASADSSESGEAASSEPDAFFNEEFEGELSNWSYFFAKGAESLMNIKSEAGRMVFEINGKYSQIRLLYNPYLYTDVRLDTKVENRGKNSNNVSLICRYSDDGWYEFMISNEGTYAIVVHDAVSNLEVNLHNGGSTAILSGKNINEYTAFCVGNTLSLYVNGVKLHALTDNKYGMRDGQVGMAVSSYEALPIIVEMDWFNISQP